MLALGIPKRNWHHCTHSEAPQGSEAHEQPRRLRKVLPAGCEGKRGHELLLGAIVWLVLRLPRWVQ